MTPNPKGLTVGRRKFEATAPNGAAAPAASPSSLYYYHADIVAEAPPGARWKEREGCRLVLEEVVMHIN